MNGPTCHRMIDLVVQNAANTAQLPSEKDFRLWVEAALADFAGDAAITIRLVDEAEGRELNRRFRDQDYATNVLSFPADVPDMIELPDLGDIVLCAPVVFREAGEQGKDADHHWAHLVIHAILHLRGHDHAGHEQAVKMESAEIGILKSLGISDPY